MFYVDPKSGIKKSYNELLEDINKIQKIPNILNSSNTYELFCLFVGAIISDTHIEIIDSDLSSKELETIPDFYNKSSIKTNVKIKNKNVKELITNFKKNNTSKISLYTSGTTGAPKKITHTLNSLSKFVKSGHKYDDNIWALAYNPTHIAGIQVFLQAFFNQNTIVEIFHLSKKDIIDTLNDNRITHISATPTFYRMLYPLYQEFKEIRNVSIGGERSDIKIINSLKTNFPNANIHNIYASTEAGSLFVSNGEFFSIPDHLVERIKIVANELLIHNSILGGSDNNSLDLDSWYSSGDMVESNPMNPNEFKFVNRKSDLIIVGGYNVNPLEVEQKLLEINGIKAVRVFGKPNSVVGNIICAEIVLAKADIVEKDIRKYLSNVLQDYKIPRSYYFTENISLTRTGKILR